VSLLKKIFLSSLFVGIGLILAYFALRFSNNHQQLKPYPYIFTENLTLEYDKDAPILIIGDRQATRLASFANFMAKKISEGLSKPIKITSLASKGEGLHRTLQKVKQLPKLPLVIIYMGGNEEFYESIFKTKSIERINLNFEKYNDSILRTLIMIFPSLSRLIYRPIDYQKLTNKIEEDTNNYTDTTIQKRNIILFQLYEEHLNELFDYTKDYGSYLIAVTQPLNLESLPKKSCSESFPDTLNDKYEQIVNLIKEKDYKAAYGLSKELTLIAGNNAKLLYIHGKIAKNLGKTKEAAKYLKLSSAFDCNLWRGNIVYNSILKKVARNNEISVFDFQKLIESEWTQNITFMDDIYPQNIYYEKLSIALAARLKKLLKL
jgi:hypothetical protein